MLLLDLFCAGGGAALGYQRAGFTVVGVDRENMTKYPGPFYQADALDLLDTLLMGGTIDDVNPGEPGPYSWAGLRSFDAIHVSPPCQPFAPLVNCRPGAAEKYEDLIAPVRERLIATGLPYVIENVPQAPLKDPVILCGTQFGRRFRLHRAFETNFPVGERVCRHEIRPFNIENSAGRARMTEEFGDQGWDRFWKEKDVFWIESQGGIPKKKLRREAVSPVYTEYIGRRLAAQLVD